MRFFSKYLFIKSTNVLNKSKKVAATCQNRIVQLKTWQFNNKLLHFSSQFTLTVDWNQNKGVEEISSSVDRKIDHTRMQCPLKCHHIHLMLRENSLPFLYDYVKRKTIISNIYLFIPFSFLFFQQKSKAYFAFFSFLFS